MDERTDEDKAVIEALADATTAVTREASRLTQEIVKRGSRKALRALLQPFMPPKRPSDPLALATYFRVPASDEPTTTPMPIARDGSPLPVSKEEKKRYAKEFFALIFKESTATLEDFHPARVRVFFRLARELARHLGALGDEQPLSDLSAWTKPLRPKQALGRYEATSRALRAGPDLAILPPPAPTSDLDGYDPASDRALVHYCQALEILARDLRIDEGTDDEPYLGRYGLRGLTDPELVRLACPSPEEILEWESQLVLDTFTVYLGRGTNGAYTWLKNEHGLTTREALPLIRAASAEALKRHEGDIEEKRAAMALRLEDFGRRARRAMNLPAELGSMKLQALVGGFARVEPENMLSELVDVVKHVNADAKRLEAADELEGDEP
jgi:hypothetical protein